MQGTLIDQGINLMLFGMGTVFVFLTILVFATTLMSKVVNFLVTDTDVITPMNSIPSTTHAVSPPILKAIEKAITLHRERKPHIHNISKKQS